MTERSENQSWENRFRAGQPEGFAALYRQYGREVLGVLLRLTHGDRAEAEDCAQDAMARQTTATHGRLHARNVARRSRLIGKSRKSAGAAFRNRNREKTS